MSLTLKICLQREDMSKDTDIIQCLEDMSYEVITGIGTRGPTLNSPRFVSTWKMMIWTSSAKWKVVPLLLPLATAQTLPLAASFLITQDAVRNSKVPGN